MHKGLKKKKKRKHQPCALKLNKPGPLGIGGVREGPGKQYIKQSREPLNLFPWFVSCVQFSRIQNFPLDVVNLKVPLISPDCFIYNFSVSEHFP